jgi:hypothetical protein
MISDRPEMKADFIAVARSISFSMSALAALSQAATEEMPAALRLRYFGVATALSRSADQSERMVERRRRQSTDVAKRRAARAETAGEVPEEGYAGDVPVDERGACDPGPDDLEMPGLGKEELAAGEAAIEAAVAEAMLEYTSRCMPARPPAEASAGPDLAAASLTAPESGGAGGANPVSRDASMPKGGAKSELAAIISVSQRLGAVPRREPGFEGNFGVQRGLGQEPVGGKRVRLPYGHEPAAMRPEVPI